jgi:hypothetical protein
LFFLPLLFPPIPAASPPRQHSFFSYSRRELIVCAALAVEQYLLYTENYRTVMRAANEIEAGELYVNRTPADPYTR